MSKFNYIAKSVLAYCSPAYFKRKAETTAKEKAFLEKEAARKAQESYWAEEMKKCWFDPVYFVNKYVKLSDPKEGLTNITLNPDQADTLVSYNKRSYHMTQGSRQSGVTATSIAYIIYLLVFYKNENIVVISSRYDSAKAILRAVIDAYSALPIWMQDAKLEANSQRLRLANGMKIIPLGADSPWGIKGYSINHLFWDNVGYTEDSKCEEMWQLLLPVITTQNLHGSRTVVLSNTGSGTYRWFWEKFRSLVPLSERHLNPLGFCKNHLHWSSRNDLNNNWHARDRFKRETKATMSEADWRSQYECEWVIRG